MASQANAGRANAIGLAGGNRAAAMAYNTAANYNNKLADERALFNIDARNTEQRMRAADFNSKIDQFNSQGDLQAQLANMHNNNLYLQAGKYKMDHRDLVDSMVAQARGSALNALAQDMATIGENNFVANQLNTNKALNYSINPYWGYSFYKGKNS